ncbi:hypothetical protein Pmar_PMAR018147, partial [Perkinsus marinus ATCC 50983]
MFRTLIVAALVIAAFSSFLDSITVEPPVYEPELANGSKPFKKGSPEWMKWLDQLADILALTTTSPPPETTPTPRKFTFPS